MLFLTYIHIMFSFEMSDQLHSVIEHFSATSNVTFNLSAILAWVQCSHCMWSAGLSFLLYTLWQPATSHSNLPILHCWCLWLYPPATCFGTCASSSAFSSICLNPSFAGSEKTAYTLISWVPTSPAELKFRARNNARNDTITSARI